MLDLRPGDVFLLSQSLMVAEHNVFICFVIAYVACFIATYCKIDGFIVRTLGSHFANLALISFERQNKPPTNGWFAWVCLR